MVLPNTESYLLVGLYHWLPKGLFSTTLAGLRLQPRWSGSCQLPLRGAGEAAPHLRVERLAVCPPPPSRHKL